MADSLGDKIKLLRKDMKMTQTELAGSEMTKSMLSQIENNTAMPSMKNLQYLALRLGKPVSYFLGENISQDNFPVTDMQKDMKEAQALYDACKYKEAAEKLEAVGKKYPFEQDSKLYADYLAKYGECLIDLNNLDKAKEMISEAEKIYERKYMLVDAAKTCLLLMGIPWNKFDYDECNSIIDDSFKIYSNSVIRDYAFELEILFYRSIIMVSRDKPEEGLKATEEALEISKRTGIYYMTDEFYKNMVMFNLIWGMEIDYKLYLDKAQQFAEATDNKKVLCTLEIVKGKISNEMNKPEEAVEYLNKALLNQNLFIAPLIHTEFAKSYYLLKDYDSALEHIKKIEYPNYIPLKYDYIYIWSSKTYEGLCLSKLGKNNEAVEAIQQGIDKMEILGVTKTLSEAYRAISNIYSDAGDYEKAYASLKKAGELDEQAKINKLYY